jgi:cytochrome c oxidase cbb3-type subunit 4
MNYNDLRHFADSWGLIFMAVVYLVLIGWHFRPGARCHTDTAAHMIFEKPNDPMEADHG